MLGTPWIALALATSIALLTTRHRTAKRNRLLTEQERAMPPSTLSRTAVVVGAAGGIGQACAHRLAEAGFSVVAVGRDRPGRADRVVAGLSARGSGPGQRHQFRACDAFSLGEVGRCADGIVRDYDSVDALVMSQGMAWVRGFTPTEEGNDKKVTLHLWSRAAFAHGLLPSLRRSDATSMPGGPVVVSVLSGGVHSPYGGYDSDPELRESYSIKNAADMAGYYNDLFFDGLARRPGNEGISFVHAAPGFVNSNWGTEMPWFLRAAIRCLQPLGKSTDECAELMVDPIIKASAQGGSLGGLRPPSDDGMGVYIMNEDSTSGNLTMEHTQNVVQSVWKTTVDVLKRAGIHLES